MDCHLKHLFYSAPQFCMLRAISAFFRDKLCAGKLTIVRSVRSCIISLTQPLDTQVFSCHRFLSYCGLELQPSFDIFCFGSHYKLSIPRCCCYSWSFIFSTSLRKFDVRSWYNTFCSQLHNSSRQKESVPFHTTDQ